jgi:tetratricopeptide (TPR) repeat protein
MKKITIFFLLFCLSALVFAQSKRDLSKARDMMSYYDYNGAMNLLEASMREATKVNLEALEALAECYRKTGELSKAERSYNWLLKTDNYSSEAHKYYGEVLMYFEQYAAAKEQFQNYLEKTGTNPLVSRLIVSCDTAMAWTLKRDSSVFKIKNENLLNTKYSEWGAIVSKDGNSLIYVSDRPSRKSTNDLSRPYRVRKPNYQEVDSVVNSNRPLRLASSAVYPLLCEDYNLGPIVYARNGKTMLYTRTSSINGKINDGVTLFERRLEIEEAVLSGNAVEKTRSFEYNKPADYSVGHPCLNLNGNILYFVSDMPGGYGGTDIYFSVRTAQGGWSSPINLGPVINTEGNEMFPTMDDEGILYFSSNGHPGYGGMDIFRAKGYRNNWTAIENLRAPINSGGDDFYLVFDGKENGFFASNRRGGLGGDDIYSFHLMGTCRT